MKRLFLLLFTFLMVGVAVMDAQDEKEVKKALKPVTKALNTLKADPTNDANINAAMAAVDDVMKVPGADKVAKTWVTKAQIYNTIAGGEMSEKGKVEQEALLKGVEPELFVFKRPEAAYIAYDAFVKGFDLTEKKPAKSLLLKDMEANSRFLHDIGLYTYQAKDYLKTYKLFSTLLKSNDLLKANGATYLLDDEQKVDDMTFYAGIAAQLAGELDTAVKIYKQLHQKGTKKIDVYEQLFAATIDKDEEEALQYLQEGRKLDPESVSLLFAEINYYLKKGDYSVLEEKLSEAMEKEPDNATLRSVMGRVYNDFYQKETDKAKKEEYYKKAEEYYKQALQIDDKNFDALYSLGELNYNSAAQLMVEYNELPVNASQREVDALKAKFMAAFERALPFFLKADDINPNDANTLIALREIYVRKDDLEKSKKYKERLEKLK